MCTAVQCPDPVHCFVQAVPAHMFDFEYVDEPAKLAFEAAKQAIGAMRIGHNQVLQDMTRVIKLEVGESGDLATSLTKRMLTMVFVARMLKAEYQMCFKLWTSC